MLVFKIIDLNFLAHLYYSFDDPELQMGNFIADEIRPDEHIKLSEKIKLGVLLHREIDRWTDGDAAFIEMSERFKPTHGRYAPVVVDIVNDHLLALDWENHCPFPSTEFVDQVYNRFELLVHELTGRSRSHVDQLLAYRYLHAYFSKEGITNVMFRMDRRTAFPSQFVNAVDQLYDHLEEFQTLSQELFHRLDLELPNLFDRAKYYFN